MNDRTVQQDPESFFERLRRRPVYAANKEYYEKKLFPKGRPETEADDAPRPSRREYETIVDDERPVLFVTGTTFDKTNVADLGPEARLLITDLVAAQDKFRDVLPLIGRIDVTNFPRNDYVGTGWFIDTDVVVTNRHVAELVARWDGRQFAFVEGVAGKVTATLCTAHEFDDPPPPPASQFRVDRVLYIEPASTGIDIAFLKVTRSGGGFISLSDADIERDQKLCTVGYPARASQRLIPDQEKMQKLFLGRYDVKRAAPGLGLRTRTLISEHDCSTLGGNSGSVVLDMNGRAAALHFAGLYQEANFAVSARGLREYQSRRRWNEPIIVRPPLETTPAITAPTAATIAVPTGAVSVTIPLTITVSLGTPITNGAAPATPTGPTTIAAAEAAAKAFWTARPAGVLAVRVGFAAENGRIGHTPFVAATVRADQLAAVAGKGPAVFEGVAVRYLPADAPDQQPDADLEEAGEIAYNDDDRRSADYSFESITGRFKLRAHVGPEYSWDELKAFLKNDNARQWVGAMYEFHADLIRKAIEERLEAGQSVRLVLDGKTFSRSRRTNEPVAEFDPPVVFADWAARRTLGRFNRIVAPKGRNGLIQLSYHTKVLVRDETSFWLSSGNWKGGSSQPVITDEDRAAATSVDLPGNREWHVIVTHEELAKRFRNHIVLDYTYSEDELHAGPVPRQRDEETVVLPELEARESPRDPPSRLLKPEDFDDEMTVRPLMTPDHPQSGWVYFEAVLELIRSARRSLLFQIPYINMPKDPTAAPRELEHLIDALTEKLTDLPDARLLLRTNDFPSSAGEPENVAWHLRRRGVDIDQRVKQISRHHTKGMVVDGLRVLIGSHNWSQMGVTTNRDASLLVAHDRVAKYYAEAFEIDWARAEAIEPRQYVPPVREGRVEESAVPAYREYSFTELAD